MDQQPNINLNYLTREMRNERDREIKDSTETLYQKEMRHYTSSPKKKSIISRSISNILLFSALLSNRKLKPRSWLLILLPMSRKRFFFVK